MAFPTIADVTTTTFSSSSTSWACNLPATVNAGDLLVLVLATFANMGATFATDPSGWTLIADGSNDARCGMWAKDADGTEGGGTVTPGDETSSTAVGMVIRINASSWGGTLGTDFQGQVRQGSSGGVNANPDPASITAAWGSADNLFVVGFQAHDDDEAATAYPTNYNDNQNTAVSGGGTNNGCSIGMASRELAAATDDAGTFTISGTESWNNWEFVVKPAAAPSGRIMGPIAGSGGLAGEGGLAGRHGGLAG